MNQILYGSNTEENIISTHHASDRMMRLFYKKDGNITTKEVEFFPFFYLANPKYLNDYKEKFWIKELAGNNYFKYLCAFPSWLKMWDAIRFILERYNENAPNKVSSYLELPILHLRPDPVSQFLTQTGRTLFKGMNFEDLYRFQIDIEAVVTRGFKRSDPNRPGDKIIIIVITDNRGNEYILQSKRGNEKDILTKFIELINEKDPDVIEGHNILEFDLPYILTRCELFSIEPRIGRDGSLPRLIDMRYSFTERPLGYPVHEIAGRQIIDTGLLMQLYDSANRVFENYSLKTAAEYFKFYNPKRTFIQRDRISWYWENEPDKVIQYCKNNVQDVKILSDILSPSVFLLAQILPLNFSSIPRSGLLAKIESLILREYLHQKYSIPKSEIGTQTLGDYSDIFYSGIFEPIINLEVESIFTSIILNDNISPKTDDLNVFNSLLREFSRLYFEIKQRFTISNNNQEKQKLKITYQQLKIIFNSFINYLGSNKTLFNDYQVADAIYKKGQHIINHLITNINKSGGIVVQIDSEDIYLVPPNYVKDQNDADNFVKDITSEYRDLYGFKIQNIYKRILSFKNKNYALLNEYGEILIKGPSIISRNIENYGSAFLRECIEALLNKDIDKLHNIYVKYYKMIVDHQLRVKDFARTEVLRDNFVNYTKEVEEGKRNRSAPYELAIQSGMRWNSGDRIIYYFSSHDTGPRGFENIKLADEWDPNFPDENVQFYLKHLYEYAKKFENLFNEKDFHSIFSVEDMFGFTSKDIKVLNKITKSEIQDSHKEETDTFHIQPRIWLDDDMP